MCYYNNCLPLQTQRKGKCFVTFFKKSRTSSAPPPKCSRQTLKPICGNKPAATADSSRFDFSKTDEGTYAEMSVPFIPENTKKNNEWAYKNFQLWRENRNRTYPDNQCPEDILQKSPWDPAAMSFWLARFACETCNTAGPVTTVFSLLSALMRRMRSIDPDCPNFLDSKNPQFQDMHCIIDGYFRELRASGIGAEVKHTSIISKEEENLLWEKGVMGVDKPESLLRAVFFYNGKNFCLRGGKEHRALKISQIIRHKDPDHYVYTAKKRSGGLNQLRLENKTVPVFPCADAGVQCHVSILDKYLSKLPPMALQKDWFYLKPLGNHVTADPSKAWCDCQPCGENKLSGMVKSMFAMVGVVGKTNHSLWATGTSNMFQAGVPEKIV